jgi:type I restriction enzyme, S subunit
MSWKYVKLGSICNTGAGGTPLKSKKEFYENGTIPWLRSGEVNNRNIVDCEIKITEKGLNNSSAKLFPSGTVLIAMYGATAGQVGILNFEASTNQAVCGILPNENFTTEFLYYFFLSFKEDLISQAVGNAQPNISQAKIKNTLIPVIPLQEQQQIVAILDKVFTAIDQAKANIEKNIENAKELFQSKLDAVFSQRGEGWEEKTLAEVCQKTSNIKWQEYQTEEFEYIDLSSVSRETLKVTETATVNKQNAPSRAKKIVYTNDVIFATTRPTLKRATIIDEELSGQLCSTGFVVLRPKAYISADWIFFFLLTSIFMQRMELLQRGASYPAVSDNDVKDSKLSVPNSEVVEKEIVLKMRKLQEEVDELIYEYSIKLGSLEELKKSILQKAFVGELTASNIIEKPKTLSLAAEPEIIYESEVPVIELHAGIIGYAYKKHLGAGKEKTFGRVKIEKIGHMAEAYAEIGLDRNPYKDAAGPNDFDRLVNVMEPYALSKNYFETQKRDSGGYDFVPKSELNKLVSKTKALLPEKKKKDLDKIIELIIPMRKVQVELVATVYAAWNNLLLSNVPVTSESIVYEARENWHPDKLKISRDKFFDTIDWLKLNDIIPKGKGKLVEKRTLF